MSQEIQNLQQTSTKKRDLFLGILFDAIGFISYAIPLLGEFSDVIWAPLSAFLMTWLYKGRIGKIAGIVTFLEEIIPLSDVIPTFTLTWIYNYILLKRK